jgi:dienelactone hydrolase
MRARRRRDAGNAGPRRRWWAAVKALSYAAVLVGLRRAGHTVHTPDLFDGRTFEGLEAGLAHAEQIGFVELIDRGVREAQTLPADAVYAGFSLGVLPAQKLAQTRPGARGALLFYSCVPIGEFASGWSDEVPVQVHGMDADPIFRRRTDLDAARTLVESTERAEIFLYRGDQHYFADGSLTSYDAEAAALLLRRTLDFLNRARASTR